MSLVGITTRLIIPDKLGPVGTVPEMSSSTPTWEVVKDPHGSGRNVLRNTNKVGQGDAHSTQSTGRDLKNGSHSFRVAGWLYEKPEDFKQTGRCLWWQCQMLDSPIGAMSPRAGEIEVVDRVGGTTHRKAVGSIPWGHGMYLVAEIVLGANGLLTVWYEVDGLPSQDDAPVLYRKGNTWQGRDAHDTIGQYATHSGGSAYIGYADIFGRGTTFAEAVQQAGTPVWAA